LLYDFDLEPDLQTEPLAELTPYVLLPEGHPLTAAAGVTLEDLVCEPFVLLDIEPSRDYFLSLFRDRELTPQIAYHTRSLETLRGFVGHGLGYSLLATKPANSMSYDGRPVVARPLMTAVKKSRLVLVTVRDRPLSALTQEFLQHCRLLFGATHASQDP
jgi:DNA-binding transcriptional LysR family regulator